MNGNCNQKGNNIVIYLNTSKCHHKMAHIKKKTTSNYLPFTMHIISLGKFNCVLRMTFKTSLSQLDDNIQIIPIKHLPQMGCNKIIIEILKLYNSI